MRGSDRRPTGAKNKVRASAASESASANGCAEGAAEGGKGEDLSILRQEAIREGAEDVEGGVPGGPDP